MVGHGLSFICCSGKINGRMIGHVHCSVHTVGRTKKPSRRSQVGRSVSSNVYVQGVGCIDGHEHVRLMYDQLSPCGAAPQCQSCPQSLFTSSIFL